MPIFVVLTTHEQYMQRCLQLARDGAGHTAPNPMVGAVLVHDDMIIGEGFHQQYGKAHAEVNCINSVSPADQHLITESILYVSLEPCSHFGKTPPCVDLIIEKKIPVVIIASKDTNPAVKGKGIEKLKANGVNVITGILEKEAIQLNKRFFTFQEKQRPYIILKWAQSSDKKIAGDNGERIFISNESTNRLVHKWRSEESAILIGTNTALKDDPVLTTRLWPGNDPLRLVLDRNLQLPPALNLFDGKIKTIVFNELKDERGEMLSFYQVDKVDDLKKIMEALYILQVQSVIVEGGAALLRSFIAAGLWDEARVITNTTMEIGKGLIAPVLQDAELFAEENLRDDNIAYYRK
jgi:diaminohydroxyphosphoribosylaminopyrimidine deaminase/5-amino-6-(5-phosphoribosylamino)uracil reductase